MKIYSIAAIAIVNITVVHAGVIFGFTGTGIHEQFSAGATAITDPFPIQLTVTLLDFPIAISNPYGVACTGTGGCPAGAGLTWLRGPGNTSDVLFFSIPGASSGFYSFQFPTGTFTTFVGPVASVLGDAGTITITATPEPRTCFMFALGLAAVYFGNRRRGQRHAHQPNALIAHPALSECRSL